MNKTTETAKTPPKGSVLGGLFSRAQSLATVAGALASGLLCATAVLLVMKFCSSETWTMPCGGLVLAGGFVVGAVAYTLFAPGPAVTACLSTARSLFLDNLVTVDECRQMRRKCLRKSLLY